MSRQRKGKVLEVLEREREKGGEERKRWRRQRKMEDENVER